MNRKDLSLAVLLCTVVLLLLFVLNIRGISLALGGMFSAVARHEEKPFLNGSSDVLDGYDSALIPNQGPLKKQEH